MIDNSSESELYGRALEAEPALQRLEQIVGWICEKNLPCNETWSAMVKPLTTPYLGASRGYGVKNADNVSRPDRTAEEELVDIMADLEHLFTPAQAEERTDRYRLPATNSTEEWLRTSEAWDAVTQVWIRRMQDAASSGARR